MAHFQARAFIVWSQVRSHWRTVLLSVLVGLVGLWRLRRRLLRKSLPPSQKAQSPKPSEASEDFCPQVSQISHAEELGTEKGESWRLLLDRLSVKADSSFCSHLCDLMERNMDKELHRLFEEFALEDSGALSAHAAAAKLNERIEVRVCVRSEDQGDAELVPITLQAPSEASSMGFDEIFTADNPLDLQAFPNLAKCCIAQRIFKTLESNTVDCVLHDITKAEFSNQVWLVTSISVDVGDSVAPLRLDIITCPIDSAKLSDSNTSFLKLAEEAGPESVVSLSSYPPQEAYQGEAPVSLSSCTPSLVQASASSPQEALQGDSKVCSLGDSLDRTLDNYVIVEGAEVDPN